MQVIVKTSQRGIFDEFDLERYPQYMYKVWTNRVPLDRTHTCTVYVVLQTGLGLFQVCLHTLTTINCEGSLDIGPIVN